MNASPPLIDPSSIDTGFVPRFRDAVAAVPVKDEAVIYEEDTGILHQLDAIATMVCSLFDGQTSLGTTIDELAAGFGADRTVIEADVLALTRQLGAKGLLDGVQGEQSDDVDSAGDADAC